MNSNESKFTADQNRQQSKIDLPVFTKWMDFMKWQLNALDNFPKKARFNFSDRIINIMLQNVDFLVEARYNRNKSAQLKSINLNLEKMRILLRICFEQRYISIKSYEYAITRINEIGKMIGGWMKQQQGLS